MDRLRSYLAASSFKIHLLLPIFTALTAFGPGFQPVITFTWLWFTLSVFYVRNITRWWHIFFYYVFLNIGTLIAFMGSMKSDVPHGNALTFAVGMVRNLLSVTSLLMDRFAQRVFDSKGWARVMVFPCVWTGMNHTQFIQLISFMCYSMLRAYIFLID